MFTRIAFHNRRLYALEEAKLDSSLGFLVVQELLAH